MAMGSRRTTPTWPVMAAVVSVLMAAPRKTPCCQPKLSKTMGMTLVRREPKMKPEIGTPCGSSQFGAMDGHWLHGTVKREFGCAAGAPPGDHALPCQSSVPAGASVPMPSHQGSFDGVMATLVKMVLERTMLMPFGLVAALVFGTNAKKARSGMAARGWPLRSTENQPILAPSVQA